jgi:hypothetical protein
MTLERQICTYLISTGLPYTPHTSVQGESIFVWDAFRNTSHHFANIENQSASNAFGEVRGWTSRAQVTSCARELYIILATLWIRLN